MLSDATLPKRVDGICVTSILRASTGHLRDTATRRGSRDVRHGGKARDKPLVGQSQDIVHS